MDWNKRLSNVYKSSDELFFDDNSKFIIMSDCHRGTGGWADTFANNQNIYYSALSYYYKENYTYIELGDGDELWENYDISEIIREHSNVFWLLSRFHRKNRLYMLYGNHDMVKKNDDYVKKNLYKKLYERQNKIVPLLENIKIHEGLILKYKYFNEIAGEIFLIHGHQVDFLNSDIWKVARFLVRFFWKPLETFGVKDITRTAKNYKKKNNVAKKLTDWVIKEKHAMIAGHNHRPAFSEIGDPPYFNDGSCVHPRCITGIEIDNGNISLIKWSVKSDYEGHLKIEKDILAGPRKLKHYFEHVGQILEV